MLQQKIHQQIGIPKHFQGLIYAGKLLQEGIKIQDYGIRTNSTIILKSHLLGSCQGTNTKGTVSFKDMVKRRSEPQTKEEQCPNIPGPYIVEQMNQVPTLTINLPKVNEIYSEIYTKAIICRFNGFWPKLENLHLWIFFTWTENCEFHLCSKGFFIVKFDTATDLQYVLNEGSWF